MEFSDVLSGRRMVRNHQPDPIEDVVLERIAAAALAAPSAGNGQGQSVVIVTDDALRTRIAELAGEPGYVERGFDPWLSNAPAHIVICVSAERYVERYGRRDKDNAADPRTEWDVPYWWIDAGASLMAVLLAAVDEGLSAGFLGAHAIPGLAGAIGLPDDERPIGVTTIGKPAPDRTTHSTQLGRSRAERLHWQHWGGTQP